MGGLWDWFYGMLIPIHMPEANIYLGLGSNLGDRLLNMEQALLALPPQVTVLRKSSIYQSLPWGYTEQPVFLNMVIETNSELEPEALLDYLKQVETHLGRKPTFRYGPRLIDLDILFYGSLVFQSERLTIPHPRLHERAFVLAPLAELAPSLFHPILHQTITSLLSQVDATGLEIVAV
jgi:2-amino-4-hydroxy-6-hydroxymethyldihydropteridine diphosphokinase